MAGGYGLGRIYAWEAKERRKILYAIVSNAVFFSFCEDEIHSIIMANHPLVLQPNLDDDDCLVPQLSKQPS